MATAAQLALTIKGVDATAKAFASVGRRIASLGASSAKMAGHLAKVTALGGLAFGGTLATGIVSGAKALGKLSDQAMRAGASVKDITQLSTALDVLGIKGAGIEELSQAMLFMRKNTGAEGWQGMREAIVTTAALGDATERAAEITKIFGREGRQLIPLVELAVTKGIGAIDALKESMTGISDRSAEMGDRVADGITLTLNAAKNAALDVLGEIIGKVDGAYGDIRQGGLILSIRVEYAIRKMGRVFAENLDVILHNMEAFKNKFTYYWDYSVNRLAKLSQYMTSIFSGAEAKQDLASAMQYLDDELKRLDRESTMLEFRFVDTSDLDVAMQERLAKVGDAMEVFGENVSAVMDEASEKLEDGAKKSAKTIREANNELIMAGSYRGRTLTIKSGIDSLANQQLASEKNQEKSLNGINTNTARVAMALEGLAVA